MFPLCIHTRVIKSLCVYTYIYIYNVNLRVIFFSEHDMRLRPHLQRTITDFYKFT